MRPSSSSPQWLCGGMTAVDDQWWSSRIVSVRTNRVLHDFTIHKEHLEGIIKKASKKVNVLSRITPYMNIAKRKLLINSFFYFSI